MTPPAQDGVAAAWQALEEHYARIAPLHLRQLFAQDPDRAGRFSAQGAGLLLDYSKNRITSETVRLLLRLAEACGVAERRDAMFGGQKINNTERRAVLHTALRAPRGSRIEVDGADVVATIHAVLDRMGTVAQSVRSGVWTGYTGRPIRNVVNIGIGGSYLGPEMACHALRSFSDRSISFRFVSNVDGAALSDAIEGLDAAETLFIISSKTFATQETMTNALSARSWTVERLGSEAAVARHFLAVSTDRQAAARFGIEPDNVFEFWDWVGGRYSMDSAIGLSTMMAIGPAGFGDLLDGFRRMDQHFRTAAAHQNLPLLLGLLVVWYRSFFGVETIGVMPYSSRLSRLPAYLQQLHMESNGKSVDRNGERVTRSTGPIIWGEPGTDGQHSFYQLLHQGTTLVPCDLIGFLRPMSPLVAHHRILMANLFAQAEALAFGKTPKEVRSDGVPEWQLAHRVFEGNRPSNVILADALDPRTLGSLVALYEHSVFTQGVIWNINSFDQWGVELGKQLARRIDAEFQEQTMSPNAHDSSTSALIERFRSSARTRGGA